jgi:hypothetical protein
MEVRIVGVGSTPTEVLDLAPRHPVDRCYECGVCLGCFGGDDDCEDGEGRPHSWVVSAEDAASFRERMGLSG